MTVSLRARRAALGALVSPALLGAAGVLALAPAPAAGQAQEYLSVDAFLEGAFERRPPEAASVLWPSPALQQRMRAVLGHPYKQLRIRYWRDGARTAWVLDEVGKDEEITIGFAVQDGAIALTEVLVFRESRGWEIRFPAFTRRFRGARLDAHDQLNQHIDGITGATLSVGAYDRLARLALMLHQAVIDGAG